ncbi:cysteine-rich repeat secretory protein 55-like [Chenopodium quinoa]|uniref:cysteine-rich repeat secretory protein 55-like n=1 Tax=Chenopodium quinoa TaxID=63459 RepID=UPI000B794BC2|nr:cysteine-rich repeat secretory protein 55-like [Chenopodium quinoa]
MASLFHIVVLLLLSLTYSSAENSQLGEYCNKKTIISSSSQVSANIDHLLADIVTKSLQGATFVKASYGNGKDTVYGLAQCRGDVDSKDCMECIQNAAKQVRKLCPNQSDARIWYDYCFLRHSQNNFFGNVDLSYGILYKNIANVTNPDVFNQELGNMFDRIDSKAVKPSSGGLGKDQKKVTDFETLYALVQCTRDLSPMSCAQCLAQAIRNFEGYCSNSKGCRVLYSSCYVRYELYPFFFPLEGQFPNNKGHSLKKSVIIHH